MFFHRSCFEALKRGPILALNLALFDSQDLASYATLVTNGATAAAGANDTAEYAEFHNTDKFMFPEDQALLDVAGSLPTSKTALNFVNLGQDNLSIIVRQAQETAGFNVTCRDYYGQGKCPEGVDEMDFVSDYMVDIFVFKGKFESSVLDLDPVYGSYFTATGLKIDSLEEFSNERTVELAAQYTGSIIPNFQDLEGNGLYIEQIVNAETRKTGLFCAINEDAIEEGNSDLVGHVYDNQTDYELLSYDLASGASATSYDFDSSFAFGTASAAAGATISVAAGELVINDDVDYSATYGATDYIKLSDGTFASLAGGVFAAGTSPALGTTTWTFAGTTATPVSTATSFVLYLEETVTQGDREIDTDTLVLGAVTASTVTVTDPGNNGMMLEVGDYLPSDVTGRLARIEKIAKDVTGTYTISCHTAILSTYDPTVNKGLKSFHKASTEYKVTNLDSIVISAQSIQNCLDAFSSGGVKSALVDRDIIDVRYFVDTFGSFEGGNLLNKAEFTKVAKERQNVSCILNAPTVSEFKKSTDPSFKDAFEGKFDTRFIPTGGDLSQNPVGTYALPSIGDGANYGFYYTPGLQVRENGKVTTVPPAAYVSNNYIDKFTDALPWSIVAGPRRGIVSGTNVIGAEYAFDKVDRDNIEPFGLNPIVFERGVGLNIKGNKTGQQVIKSALSSAHVREVLIFIENGLADILKGYMFEFNTAQTRLEIKTLADSFMEGVLADQGVYAYKNVMDSTNNTNEVIDNNMGILDTYVEPVKGLEIIVHRTTVLNTGEIASGGY